MTHPGGLYERARRGSDWLMENACDWNPAGTLHLVRSLDKTGSSDRRLVFFGAFKTGKSTLINAMLDTDHLPVGILSTTGVPVHISHGRASAASLVCSDAGGRTRSFPVSTAREAAEYMLVGREKPVPAGMQRIDRVEIKHAHPLLKRFTFVDTPGLDDSIEGGAELEAMTLAELAQADLAVCVLSAWQALKESERGVIARAHELLAGNLIFVLNRLYDVPEARKDRLTESTRRTLSRMGNGRVGLGRVFLADRDRPLEGSLEERARRPRDPHLAEFHAWLGSGLTDADLNGIMEASRASAALASLRRLSDEALAQLEASAAAAKQLEIKRAAERDKFESTQVQPLLDAASAVRAYGNGQLYRDMETLFGSLCEKFMTSSNDWVTCSGTKIAEFFGTDLESVTSKFGASRQHQPDVSSLEEFTGRKKAAPIPGSAWMPLALGIAASLVLTPAAGIAVAAGTRMAQRTGAKPADADPWSDAKVALRQYLTVDLYRRFQACCEQEAASLERQASSMRSTYRPSPNLGDETAPIEQLESLLRGLKHIETELTRFTV